MALLLIAILFALVQMLLKILEMPSLHLRQRKPHFSLVFTDADHFIGTVKQNRYTAQGQLCADQELIHHNAQPNHGKNRYLCGKALGTDLTGQLSINGSLHKRWFHHIRS